MMGYKSDLRDENGYRTFQHFSTVGVPASVDWRSSGAVSGVKNQGSCGSCWAFSSTGALEGITKIKTGTLYSLSEQQFVDCSRSYGNLGCNGGVMDNAFRYAESSKIEQENDYPYTGSGSGCSYNAAKGVVLVKGYTDVAKNTPSQLQAALA